MKLFFRIFVLISVLLALAVTAFAQEGDDPELIFKKTTVWRLLSPDAKLATYVIDDPQVDGVACYFTVPEIGGWSGWAGFAEERSEHRWPAARWGRSRERPSLHKARKSTGSAARSFSRRCRSCAAATQSGMFLVYLAYTDKIIEGSPQNSTSTVPIMPWGTLPAPKCGEFLNK